MVKFFVTEEFKKALNLLEQNIQKRVKDKLRMIAKNEDPLIFAKRLKGYRGVYRFRVGDYRIVFRLDKDAIVLLTVSHRKDVYEGL